MRRGVNRIPRRAVYRLGLYISVDAYAWLALLR